MTDKPEILLSCVSSVYVRQMTFHKAGDIEQGHAHKFDHQTLVAKGSVKITTNGKESVFSAPHIVFIRKEQVHELVAMEDNTVCYCIHALRDGDDVCDIIPPDAIPFGAGSEEAFKKADSLLFS
jgi:quercetin dioxygenase-like cupin family protein